MGPCDLYLIPTRDCINFICEANFDNKKLGHVCPKRRGSNAKIKFWDIFFSFLCQNRSALSPINIFVAFFTYSGKVVA